MTSYKCKPEYIFMLQFCTEINVLFTGLLFHINSALIYSLSPSKQISNLNLVGDSWYICEDNKIYFCKHNWSVKSPFFFWKYCICTACLSTYCCTYFLPVQLLTYQSSSVLHFAPLLTVLLYPSFKGKIELSSALCMSSRCFCIFSSIYFMLFFIFYSFRCGRSRVRFPMVSLEFFIDLILPAALWTWGRFSL